MIGRFAGALGVLLAALAFDDPPAAPANERPSARSCFSATALPQGGVLVWGGAVSCGVGIVEDTTLWSWDGKAWSSSAGPPIEPRDDALLLSGPADGTLTLFGGRRGGQAFDDLWVREGEDWRQVRAEGGPGPIQHGAAALDPLRQRIVVFGGAVGTTLGAKTHEWDGTRWHASEVAGPSPRVGHGMAWSRQGGGVLLYGGFAGDTHFRDLWRWDGTSWKLLSENGPTETEGAVIAEADVGIHVVGPDLAQPARTTIDVWKWDGESFALVAAPQPQLRIGASAIYDRARRVLVPCGGNSGSEKAESQISLWELDGLEWRDPSR